MTADTEQSGIFTRLGSAWTSYWFTARDPHALGLLRLITGLIALWWYLSYLPNLQMWFGPEGLFPLEFVQQLRTDLTGVRRGFDGYVSIFDFVHSVSLLWAVYAVGLVAILSMTAGFFSRISTIIAFVFVVSLIHRAPMIARPVDDVLAMVMFYLAIGPSGASYSIDAWRNKRALERVGRLAPGAGLPIEWSFSANVATRLLQIHLALIYFATAIAQLQGIDWWQGLSVWWMMARPESRLIDLTFLAGTFERMGMGLAFTYLVNFFTHAIVAYEICFALFIWNQTARPILLILGVFLWVGLALIGGSVSFAILMLAANLIYVDPATLRQWCPRRTPTPIPAAA